MPKCPTCQQEVKSDVRAILNLARPTAMQRRIAEIVIARPGLYAEQIADIVYADDRDGGPLYAGECIKQAVCQLNKKLRPLGWIVTGQMMGYGYVAMKLD